MANAAIILLSSSPAAAQALSAEDAAALNEAVKPSAVLARTGAGTLDSSISLPNGFEFATDEESSEVTFKASVQMSGNPRDPGAMQYFSFKATIPFEKDASGGVLNSLRGLGNAKSVEVSYNASRLVGTHHPTPRQDGEIRRICREALAGYNSKEDDKANVAPPTCEEGNVSLKGSQVVKYSRHEYENWDALFFDRDAYLTQWGVSGAAGTEKFDYKDAATLADRSVDKTPWSVGAYFAYERLNWQALVTARFDHRVVYEAAKKEIRCSNPGDTTTCVEALYAAPKKSEQDIASLELRRRIGKFGFALTASYDVGEDNVAFDLPIYFVRDDEGGLTGGVRATWDSKDRETKVGVFLNRTAFSLFGDL